jgi:hypothetical protein
MAQLLGQLSENLDDLKAFMEEGNQCLCHQQENMVAHGKHVAADQKPICKTEAPKDHQLMHSQLLDLESQESMAPGEQQPQPQGQPTLPRTELEEEALASESRNTSVGGDGCLLEVMAEDLEPQEGVQHLYRNMGAIGECTALSAVLKEIEDKNADTICKLARDKLELTWDLQELKFQLDDQGKMWQVPQEEHKVVCDEGEFEDVSLIDNMQFEERDVGVASPLQMQQNLHL